MTIAFESAQELARKIREREISSRELTEYFIGRIERFDDSINAVVVRDFDRALKDADAADSVLARNEAVGPFHGLPMTIKEAYNIAGLPTTWGIADFKDNIADEDADAVSRLRTAGAHFLGKTNVPRALVDGQSYNEIYGTTNNPWNTERVPGGSSGGAAAAVAAGLTSIESGSDAAGSIRSPAHYCGVYGHKPTQGIVSGHGHALKKPSTRSDLGVIGPIARDAGDLAAWMKIVAAPEPLDRPGWVLNLPQPCKRSLSEYRVALWTFDWRAPVSLEISDRVQTIADRLSARGAIVSDTARPAVDVDEAWRVFLSKLRSPGAKGLSDEQFGQLKAVADGFGSEDQSDEAIQARAAVQSHRDWLQQNDSRELIRMAWREFFKEWDILICPSTMTTAFHHDHSPKETRTLMVNGEQCPYIRTIFWVGLISVASLPSTVFPTGTSAEGLPIGLQAVSAEYNDYICIDFARLMGDEFGGFVPPGGYED